MNTYMGKIAVIDLTTRTVQLIKLETDILKQYIGGKGFGAWLAHEFIPQDCDPYGPENLLMFMTGPLTGTLAPSMRGCVITKSPLSLTFSDSYFGGHFSPEIKYAGYDGLVVKGISAHPVYIWIDDDNIEFKDASSLWGMDALDTNHKIKTEHKDPSIKVVSIGPAGENRVRFALISCEYNRQAARGGVGAVMGSKRLKAVAIRGSQMVRVHDIPTFMHCVKKAYAECSEEKTGAFTSESTPGALDFANESGLLPTRNYQSGTFEKVAAINGRAQKKILWLRSTACAGCAIRCGRIGKIRTGRYAGTVSDVVEYETLGMLGSNLGISNMRGLIHLNVLCDRLGLDSISTGGVVGFAMEAYHRGLIKNEKGDGDKLTFGNVNAAAALIKKIAYRKGNLGSLLAEGVKRASEQIGEAAQEFAVHVKGMETPAWGPRGAPAMGLAYATSDRGGCHMRAFPVLYEFGGSWKGEPVDQLSLDQKAEIVVYEQNRLAALDTLVMCDFAAYGIQKNTYLEMLAAATGLDFKAAAFFEVGERIWNLVRCFNLEQGLQTRYDTLPKRFMQEPLPDGPSKGHRISREDLTLMLQDYYGIRGWNNEGQPTSETLERLNIHSGK